MIETVYNWVKILNVDILIIIIIIFFFFFGKMGPGKVCSWFETALHT